MAKIWNKYNILDSEKLLKEAEIYLMDGDQPRFDLIAVDTETTGLHFLKNVLIGISFSLDKNSGFYIPLLVWKPFTESEKQRTIDKVKRPIFEEGCLLDPWTNQEYPEDVTIFPHKVKNFLFFLKESV